MKLIVGLGNPEKKYFLTRHNAGFLAIDQLQKELGFPAFKFKKGFNAEISQGEFNKEKIILAKPQTYMNRSGLAVKTLVNFYKIKPQDIWLIHDDIDLPLGKIKISQKSSAAGHLGVASVIESLNSKNFIRFRMGILATDKIKISTEKYVLEKFNSQEEKIIKKTMKIILTAITISLTNNISEAMNKFN